MSSNIEILDCTLRDGSYPVNYFYSLDDTRRVSEILENSGVKRIEVGHGMGLGASLKGYGTSAYSDIEYIESAARAVRSAQIGVFAIPGVAETQQVIDAKKAGISFIRIGTDVDKIESARELVELAGSLGLSTSLNIMKSYARPKEELLESILSLGVSSLDIISIVDSAGTMIPGEVKSYVSFLVDHLQNRIGFHGHNNLQLAIANSIAAVEGGASVIDATLRGIGRSSGNAQIEVLVPVLARAGYQTNIDYQALSDFSDLFYEPPYPQYGIQGIELACGVFGLHSSFLPRVVTEANSMGIDIVELITEVTRNDKINLDLGSLQAASNKIPRDINQISILSKSESESLESVQDLIDALFTYATKFNKKSILTLSQTDTEFSRITRLTSHDEYIIGHAEVSENDAKQFTSDEFLKIHYLGIDRHLMELSLEINLQNVFVYDEVQVIDLLISEMILNLRQFQGRFRIQSIGERKIDSIERIKEEKKYQDSEIITFVTSKLSSGQEKDLQRNKTSKVIFLHPDYMPLGFEGESGVEIYRLDTRPFFDLHVISLARNARDFGTARFLTLGGVTVIAGGFVAPRGTLVVDNPINPKQILGVASGAGTLLSKKDEVEFESDIKTVASALLESNLRFLRSGD